LNKLYEFVTNYNLICALVAWFVAQVAKIVLCLVKEKRIDFQLMLSSGGMPSSHSAMVCAILGSFWFTSGPGTDVFALAAAFAMLTMYDAANVRRESGKHAKLLNDIVKDFFEGKQLKEEELKELIGHTPLQVCIGAVLGIIVAVVLYFIML